jgi:murein DD-endopeptidase MepM/ murein hydrolase activator NlpD
LYPPVLPDVRARWSRHDWLLAGALLFVGTAVVAVVPGLAKATRSPSAGVEPALVTLPLRLPALTDANSRISTGWQFVRVHSGQTLGAVFSQLGLPASLMQRLLEASSARSALSHLRTGQELAFELDGDGQLRTLRFDKGLEQRVSLSVDGDNIRERIDARPVERRTEIAGGTIHNSLYADGARAGLSSGAINELANVFKYDIDFAQDVRDGDSFQVVYEELWRDGQQVGSGNIIAATFSNRGKHFNAFRFEHDGQIEYFDETGRPLRKALMRMPIEFARLSSTFGMRNHPILGRMRMHKGVDYAAPKGTPIMAAGAGRVKYMGWQNGYGRCVEIDHGQGRSTFYGHMSKWGPEKVGQHVGQGSIIGYVGMTGLATAPHLHYEFRIHEKQVNPLTVTMPRPEPLKGAELARFRSETAPAVAKLQLAEKFTRVAAR